MNWINKTSIYLSLIILVILIACRGIKTEEINTKDMEANEPTPKEQCPCCDYISLAERNNYFICPICFWEDDGIDVDNLDEVSGPNHMTLREGRRNFKEIGACEESMLKNVLSVEERKKYRFKPRIIE